MTVNYSPEAIRARFLKKTEIDVNGCWIWKGRTNRGYGIVRFRSKIVRTHRLSWELFRGEIPTGICVLHQCDVPACVNPDHLFLGTLKDNSRDAFSKGRMRNYFLPREGHKLRKLSEVSLARAKEMRSEGFTYEEIGLVLGVSEGCICAALTGASWRNEHGVPIRT